MNGLGELLNLLSYTEGGELIFVNEDTGVLIPILLNKHSAWYRKAGQIAVNLVWL